jgi:hypothetical protein
LILLLSRSDIPPQIPNFSEFSIANSQHSSCTLPALHIDLAFLVEAPLSGKKISASAPLQFASSVQGGFPPMSSSIIEFSSLPLLLKKN